MGIGGSKTKEKKKTATTSNKPKTMPYKRQFSSDVARQSQQTNYKDYRQSTLSVEEKKLAVLTEEEKAEANNEYDKKHNKNKNKKKPNIKVSTKIQQDVAKYDNAVLDPKKYKPPPSPAISDNIAENGKKYIFINVFICEFAIIFITNTQCYMHTLFIAIKINFMNQK